jgi:hypothetical protein
MLLEFAGREAAAPHEIQISRIELETANAMEMKASSSQQVQPQTLFGYPPPSHPALNGAAWSILLNR